MEKLYKQILEKYKNGDFLIKSRLNEKKEDIKNNRFSYLAKEYMVFLWMKENSDDRWKQMLKTVLVPNDLTASKLNITEIMNFIDSTDKDYSDESVITLFLDKIEKVEVEEVKVEEFIEEDYFKLDDEETVIEPVKEEIEPVKEETLANLISDYKEDVFFEILEEITEEKPVETPKVETPKVKKPKKVVETSTLSNTSYFTKQETIVETKQETIVQPKQETIVVPVQTYIPENIPAESITIDRYVYNLIENVEDKTKYIETLILKDLFSK